MGPGCSGAGRATRWAERLSGPRREGASRSAEQAEWRGGRTLGRSGKERPNGKGKPWERAGLTGPRERGSGPGWVLLVWAGGLG